jgi:hypothetical protein
MERQADVEEKYEAKIMINSELNSIMPDQLMNTVYAP